MSVPSDESQGRPAVRRSPAARAFVFVSRVVILFMLTVPVLRWTGIVESLTFFHPRSTQPKTPKGFEDVFIPTPDGRTLHAWFMPSLSARPGHRSPAILHCHGNEGDVSYHDGTSDYLPAAGVSVLLFDYRGFGRSTPERILTRKELLEDAEAALAYLRSRADVDPGRIGAFGYSLGGSFALQIAADHPDVRAVVSVATFSSWPSVASDVIPYAGYVLIRNGLAPIDNVVRLGDRPLLLVHGKRDEIVGFQHMERIERAAKSAGVRVESVVLPDAGHLNVFTPAVEARISDFFVKALDVQ